MGEDIPLPAAADDDDVFMADMHSESARLGAETDRAMRDQNKGDTFASYMQAGGNIKQQGEDDTEVEEDSSDDGDNDAGNDSDFEEGLIAVGLVSAKKPKSGKVQEEHVEKVWLNALGQIVRINPENPEEPTAINNIAKAKSKAKGRPDPNGRFIGRHLVNWHRMSLHMTIAIPQHICSQRLTSSRTPHDGEAASVHSI